MGDNTKIEWADKTFNPVIGCQKVSPGCDLCYAETMMDFRYHRVSWGQRKTETTAPSVGTRIRTSTANWRLPFRWAKAAREAQQFYDAGVRDKPQRPRVFCASLSDVFDNQWPDGVRNDLWRMIEATPELDWLLLTKRPENIPGMLPSDWSTKNILAAKWAHVWLGFTAEDQEHFDRRWPLVQRIPARVRFCSYEPAIGPLRLFDNVHGLHWMICGGESGPGHRIMSPNWELDIRSDCYHAGVAYYFKQLAGKRPIPTSMTVVREFPRAA